MKRGWPRIWRWGAAGISAAALASSFAPAESAGAAWIAVAPLVILARFTPPKRAFKWGFVAGLLFWCVTLAWLWALCRSGGHWTAVGSAWLLLSAYCALYTGAFTCLAAALWPAADRSSARHDAALVNIGRVLALPLIWVGLEYLRATVCSGFAWNLLGASQFRNLAVIQVAEWGGVYAVSGVVVAMNAGIALTAMSMARAYLGGQEGRRRRAHPELMVALAIFGAAMIFGLQRCRMPGGAEEQTRFVPLRVAAVQLNIPQDEKWTQAFMNSICDQLGDLTEQALWSSPELIVWPETATPVPVLHDPLMRDQVMSLAQQGTPILAGSMAVHDDEGTRRLYNSALLFMPDSRIAGTYHKRHLVPFGEYIPLADVLNLPDDWSPLGYNCSPGSTSTVFRLETQGVPFSSLICFEDTVAPLAVESVRNGARLLINQTNDGWFEGTALARQHLAQCVLRAVENRVPVVRCANMGVSAFIRRTGALDEMTTMMLARGEATRAAYRVDSVDVPVEGMALTPYTRHGDRLFALPCAVGVVLALLYVLRPWLRWRSSDNQRA